MPAAEPVPASIAPQTGLRRPTYFFIYIIISIPMNSALSSFSSGMFILSANTAIGSVVEMPWLPLPQKVITEPLPPLIRKSAAAAGILLTAVTTSAFSMPFSSKFCTVGPTPKAYFFSMPFFAISILMSMASLMNCKSATSTSFAQ